MKKFNWKEFRNRNKEKAYKRTKEWIQNNKEHVAAYAKARYEKHKDKFAKARKDPKIKERNFNAYLKRVYGITLQEYKKLLDGQHNRCAICNDLLVKRQSKNVDHDHDSGTVRGILCIRCNLFVGQIEWSFTRLKQALHYITKNSTKSSCLLTNIGLYLDYDIEQTTNRNNKKSQTRN